MGRVETRKKQKEMFAKRRKEGKAPKSFAERLKNFFRGPSKTTEADEIKKKAPPSKKPTPRPKAKKKFGMGMVDSMPKAKVKQGPPKPPAKKKKRSNITNSSSYDPVFAAKTRNKRLGIKPKGTMTGSEMMQPKKDDGKAPMYESKGTKGKIKRGKMPKINNTSRSLTNQEKVKKIHMQDSKMLRGSAQYKMGGGKMKMAKYYSGGGTVYTGR